MHSSVISDDLSLEYMPLPLMYVSSYSNIIRRAESIRLILFCAFFVPATSNWAADVSVLRSHGRTVSLVYSGNTAVGSHRNYVTGVSVINSFILVRNRAEENKRVIEWKRLNSVGVTMKLLLNEMSDVLHEKSTNDNRHKNTATWSEFFTTNLLKAAKTITRNDISQRLAIV
jgi:hypothetical protein